MDTATAAFQNASLDDKSFLNGGPSAHLLRAPASAPAGARGLAARRKLGGPLKLPGNDLPGGLHLPPVALGVGGGPSGAGLGGGRPRLDDEGQDGGQNKSFSTPFANFSRIVYVSSSSTNFPSFAVRSPDL